jgi:galactokinase
VKTVPSITDLRSRPTFSSLYAEQDAASVRWERLITAFTRAFGVREGVRFFSSPGRTELGGNHTDHNNGIVLAAAVDLDSIAVVSPTDDNRVTIHSEGFAEPFIVDLSDLEIHPEEAGTTSGLIRGIAARLRQLGHGIGGFDAFVASDVLVGSGLSSSASIEVLVATVFNAVYNQGSIDAVTLAKVGQFAENNYFGKPSGLMDQIACAVGGAVMIDFQNPESPLVREIEIEPHGDYALVVVDTGGSHADLTDDYASIPREMRGVAELLGKRFAREIDLGQLNDNIVRLRQEVGDRAILRTLHFLHENDRVLQQAAALKARDIEAFLELVRASGDSSCRLLQNCFSPAASREQGIMLALALSEDFLRRAGGGACRVHGGGFAGTIQSWVPGHSIGAYEQLMNDTFGKGSVIALRIRGTGTTEI